MKRNSQNAQGPNGALPKLRRAQTTQSPNGAEPKRRGIGMNANSGLIGLVAGLGLVLGGAQPAKGQTAIQHSHNPVLIKNATILTVTKGTLKNSDILLENGKIARIGKNLSAPAGATRLMRRANTSCPASSTRTRTR